MDSLRDLMWLVWLGAALVAGVLEIASLDLVLVMLAGGAVAAAGAAGLDLGFPLQVLTFALTSTVLLVGVRPALKRYLDRGAPFSPTNVDALLGRTAEAITEVSDLGGTVKLAGETWTARTVADSDAVGPGTLVDVVAIDGATAVVRRRPPQDSPPSLPFTER